jgi:hypothetical protein
MTSAFEKGMNELKRALWQTAEGLYTAQRAGGRRGNVHISGQANVVVSRNVGQPGTMVAAASQHAPIRQDRREAPVESDTTGSTE